MFNLFRSPGIEEITPQQAYEMASSGEVMLVDVRTPEEWAKTGVAEPAITITLQDPQFLQKLEEATGGDKSKKVAFICASGGRSMQVAQALKQHGWENVYNVTGGTSGSPTQQGWIQLGLPVKPYQG